MAAPPVGLDITSSSIVAVILKKKGKAYSVQSRAEGALPPGIVSDGEVHDPDALTAALTAFWKEHGLKDKRVAIGVANQRCVTRVIEMPRIKNKKQLREALSFEVADNLPIPLEEIVWDYHTVARWKEDGITEKERHVVVMVYRESMERWRDSLSAAGLKLVRIDLAAFALMRAGLSAVKMAQETAESTIGDDGNTNAVALLDVGPTSTNLVISRDDVCELNRIIAFGKQHFAQTLVEQFGWGQEDAERVAGEAGIVPPGGVEQPGDPYSDARRVMQFVADQFGQEIKTSLDYYSHTTNGKNRVSKVVIAGEGSLLRGLDLRLSQETGLDFSMLDASPRLEASSVEQLGERHSRYGIALGLAMEEAA